MELGTRLAPPRPLTCPSPEVWDDFQRGRVDQATFDTLSQHLQDCSECLQVLDELSSQKLSGDATFARSPFLDEDHCRRLQERVSQLRIVDGADASAWSTDQSSRVSEQLPEQLGRYQVRRVLGAGGFGRVYLADDPLLERQVAIKVPRRSLFGTDGERSDFLSEARHAAALDHHGIVPIFDVLPEDSGRVLIVMKYVEGQTLKESLCAGPLPLPQAVKLVMQIARAVHVAHEQGFVHRDLKPSNILIDAQGRPQVTDLGLSLNLQKADPASIGRAGTAAYMAPEQIRHEVSAIDRRTDVWTLGVLLAEMIHGRRPFPQKDRQQLFAAITTEQPQLESSAELVGLNDVIRRCLAKQPADRFPTAEAFAEELSLWRKQHFPTGWDRWRSGWRRNAVVAAVLLLVVTAVSLSRIHARQTELRATLTQLESAPAHQIPKLVLRLREASANVDSVSLRPDPGDAAGRFRFDVARLALGDRHAETITRIADELQTAQADEIAAVVQTLRETDNLADLVRELVARLSDPARSTEMRFRLAAALAGLAPDDAAWPGLQTDVARWLISRSEDDLPQWWPLFDPIGATRLAEPLQLQMNSADLPREAQTNAARTLARFLAADVARLAPLVKEADAAEIPPLVEGLKPAGSNAIRRLQQSFDELLAQPRTVPTDDLAPPTVNDIQDARLAIALWLLGDPNAVCEALRHDPNPTLQTLVIHGLAEQAVEPNSVIEVLRRHQAQHDEHSTTIKFGLLQVLGLLPPNKVRPQLSAKWLNEFWQNDPDSGVHSTVGWLAQRLEYELPKPDVGEHGRWLVDQAEEFEQTFAIVEPHVAELGIHDLRQTPVLTVPWPRHQRRFPWRFAIAMHEVTIAQFRQFDANYRQENLVLNSSARDAAMMLVTLKEAYGFCNWCSDQFGLERCYEPDANANVYELVPRVGHLSLSGYRLPTDAEWECACRAGTSTSRYFGQAVSFLPRYAWAAETPGRATRNGSLLSQPVCRWLPNRWGLFDTYGNAKELCDMSVAPTDSDAECTDEIVPLSSTGPGSEWPMIRGLNSESSGSVYAHSHCRTNRIRNLTDPTVGFRVARTLIK